ncbi:MAG: hypothetical protein AAGB10_22130 [Pseudomonadota bacterium]
MALRLAYVAAALMATPAPAADLEVFKACSVAPIGSETCDPDALAEGLGLLSAGDMRVFRDAGMESFAMLTALRYAASAIYFEAEGDGCYAEEERTAAVEIWSIWVQVPEGVPAAIKERYDVYAGVMDAVVNMEVGC